MSWNSLSQEDSVVTYQRYLGIVEDNNDPKRLQRIKVRIPNKMEGSLADREWLAPIVSSPFGIGPTFGSMLVPAIDSIVIVYFQEDNIKYGLYEGSAAHVNFVPHPELLVNYPKRYGFCDPAGNYTYVDYTEGQVTIKIRHVSGTEIVVDNEGNVTGLTVGNQTLTVQGNTTVTTHGNTSITTHQNTSVTTHQNTTVTTQGNTSIVTSGSTEITSSGTVFVSSPSAVTIVSSVAVNITAPSINLN